MAGQQLLTAHLTLSEVKVIIAAVGGDSAVTDLDDASHQAIHELAIVAGHDHGTGELGRQPALQPDDRFDIEMVGRLIQKQYVGIDGQNLRQGNAHLPTATETLHRPLIIFRTDTEPR